MMRRIFLVIAACLWSASALAQQQTRPTDSQLQDATALMYQAEAQRFALWSQRLQADLADERAARTAEKEYWKAYVEGLGSETKVGEAH